MLIPARNHEQAFNQNSADIQQLRVRVICLWMGCVEGEAPRETGIYRTEKEGLMSERERMMGEEG